MPRALLLAALIAGWPIAAAAQDAPQQESVATPSDAESTALQLATVDTRMTVEVLVNGAGPFRFLVDSGANRSVISRELAVLLALPDAGAATLHSVGGATTVETVRIDRIDMGKVSASGIVAPTLAQADIGASGILGIDALAGKQAVLDLAEHRMTIRAADRRSAAATAEGEIVVTARRRFGQLILVDAALGGRSIYVVLDTGTDTSIGNLALLRQLSHRKNFAPETVSLHDVTGQDTIADIALLPRLRLGGIEVIGAPAAFVDAHPFRQFRLLDRPAMLLGMDLLRSFRRIAIDFGAKTVRFTL